MPFKSYAQQKYMFEKMPEVAKRWAEKYGAKKKPKNYKPKPKSRD